LLDSATVETRNIIFGFGRSTRDRPTRWRVPCGRPGSTKTRPGRGAPLRQVHAATAVPWPWSPPGCRRATARGGQTGAGGSNETAALPGRERPWRRHGGANTTAAGAGNRGEAAPGLQSTAGPPSASGRPPRWRAPSPRRGARRRARGQPGTWSGVLGFPRVVRRRPSGSGYAAAPRTQAAARSRHGDGQQNRAKRVGRRRRRSRKCPFSQRSRSPRWLRCCSGLVRREDVRRVRRPARYGGYDRDRGG